MIRNIFQNYFDFTMPELRIYNRSIWVKTILIYKFVIPILFLFFLFIYIEYTEKLDLIKITLNITIIIVGLENSIGVITWMFYNRFSIYNFITPIIMFIIDL